MLNIYIKYFFIILCSLYTYTKLLKFHTTKQMKLYGFVFCLFFPFAIYFIKVSFPFLIAFLPVFILAFFTKNIYKHDFNLSLITSTMSFALNFVLFLISTILSSVFANLIGINVDSYFSILLLFTGIIQLTLVYFLFTIKRLKSGMPFLFFKLYNDFGIIICIIIILLISFLGYYEGTNEQFIIYLSASLICGIIFYMWWKIQIKKTYIKRITDNQLNELSIENEILKKEIEQLSALSHRDSKFMSAVETELISFINLFNEERAADSVDSANKIIANIRHITEERKGHISTETKDIALFHITNHFSTDAILTYLNQLAISSNVDFSFSIKTDLTSLYNEIIDENQLNTLFGDLIDNAIIASQNKANGKVHTSISFENDYYCINILDNGDLFDILALSNWGISKYTGHKYSGGSGIGLMTTYKILSKLHASFEIDETLNNLYTKKVSVCFDGLGQYRIKTNRTEVLSLSTKRKDIIFM